MWVSYFHFTTDRSCKAEGEILTSDKLKIAKYLKLNAQGISHNILCWIAVRVLCDGAYM